MGKKRYRPEEIIRKLREAEVLLGQGQNTLTVCRQLEVTSQTFIVGEKNTVV